MTTTALVIYFLIAKVFFVLTLIEGILRNLPWSAARFSGLALTAIWPVILFAIAWHANRKDGSAKNKIRDSGSQKAD